MEDGGGGPGEVAGCGEGGVVGAEGVGGGDVGVEVGEAPGVGGEVEEGEEDREGLLQAEEPVEGPLAVELVDRGQVRDWPGEAGVGDDVLAGVVAGRRARPEEEAVVEGWGWVSWGLFYF